MVEKFRGGFGRWWCDRLVCVFLIGALLQLCECQIQPEGGLRKGEIVKRAKKGRKKVQNGDKHSDKARKRKQEVTTRNVASF